MESSDIEQVMQGCFEDQEMIDHLVREANCYMTESGEEDSTSQYVNHFQVKHLLQALAENTDFSEYT
jgi:hypothetical protein